MAFEEEVKNLEKEFFEEINNVKSISELDELKIRYLGRKGKIRKLFSDLSELPLEEKKEAGNILNSLKNRITSQLALLRISSGIGVCIYESSRASIPPILWISSVVSSSATVNMSSIVTIPMRHPSLSITGNA